MENEQIENKPISLLINETKNAFFQLCNQSNLPPSILELIIECIHNEVHEIANREFVKEKITYDNLLKEQNKNTESKNSDQSESEEQK